MMMMMIIGTTSLCGCCIGRLIMISLILARRPSSSCVGVPGHMVSTIGVAFAV
jgi:hypothetical protein